jgi:hypothetical protein
VIASNTLYYGNFSHESSLLKFGSLEIGRNLLTLYFDGIYFLVFSLELYELTKQTASEQIGLFYLLNYVCLFLVSVCFPINFF